ncbi:MAG: glycerol-3-phosphate cytidylyltransferase [Stygiobacter sp. RIFOXYC12_FULL_38_8]|nr:MAG: glycerol-3-phosphate cytidylyltransferase [Stygiobacter sp. GWC2_38_9]OGU82436.1 MAG: glycerol-3-phosphate cytidylyltransferase [Stygiobacter sp. RIFOXYA12_FULL_38_9]OGV08105.1 MAG: glycerol-3-phosphate cytidylyltransferase [Stygiobacter sp. RIFOXYB2_FULL_37_11]OGV15621.1 MAG: glycerol-3-phosphate cytidylyltransferase [Stygiobacter sp. RIFOXYC2_FULL_38_25]OGV16415.1 MAG: glycerol-3-phosphate cytidylyltransferase [Stygiobacter sp. RIFOXYA2_FULL_38_8]OGV26337.1 MAG: glycerol-3-phosphate 
MSYVKTIDELCQIRKELKAQNKKVVFTNGVFDILHAGHVDYLGKAKEFGDVLIVGVNSDASVKRIKGELRPVVPQNERAFIISSLKPVDFVTIFEEDTPFEVINKLIPDVLVKGADWSKDKIVGADVVEANGGSVETIKFVNQTSTTNIIKTVLEKHKD